MKTITKRLSYVSVLVLSLLILNLAACRNHYATDLPAELDSGKLNIVPGHSQQPVNLSQFPQKTQITFSLHPPSGHLEGMVEDNLILFEDGQLIKVREVEPVNRPISFVFIFDIGDKEIGMVTTELFEKLLNHAASNRGDSDRWVFCSTKLPEVCSAPQEPSLEEHSLNNWYDMLSSSPEDPIYAELPTILRQTIALSSQPPEANAIIIVKHKIEPSMPYLPDPLVTDLLISRTPITLVNLTENDDEADFLRDTHSRLEQLNGFYIHGDPSWGEYLEKAIMENRQTNYVLSYESHLFHDNETHQILLGYRTSSWEAWDRGEFHFLPTENNTNSSLRLYVQIANAGLLFCLPFILLAAFVIITYEPRAKERHQTNANAAQAGADRQ